MKKLTLLLFTVIIFSVASAQKELGDNEHYITLIHLDGTEKEVILLQNLKYPWYYQKKISIVDKEVFESVEKIKNKNKNLYKPSDVKGFRIGTQLYETQKYSDLSALGMASLPTDYFLEVAVYGKVKIYKFYQTPYVESGSAPLSSDELNQKFRDNPLILIWKEGEKTKEVSLVKIEKYFGDNERVMGKYAKGEYGNTVDDPDKKVLGKLLDKAGDDKEQIIIQMAIDYNQDYSF